MIALSRGDIVWVQLPPPAGHVGHEEFGRRPALVIQDEPALSALPTVLVVPLTSQKGSLRFRGTHLIQPTPGNGLKTPSVALAFQVRAVDRSRIKESIGQLDEGDFQEVERQIHALMGFRC